MNNMKKLASLLMAALLVFAMAATAFAADSYSITINNSAPGHTYEAYQLFSGKLSDGVLTDIQWGSGVANAASLGTAADIAARLDAAYTGADKLTVEQFQSMIRLGDACADSGETSDPYVISGLEAGYYLVKDRDGSLNGAEGEAYTAYLTKVVANVTATPKSDVPQVIKKVKDINDTLDSAMTDWQDSADHDMGDSVPFLLKATLADNVSAYEVYQVVFHDTMSKGLTLEATYAEDGKTITAGLTVKIDGNDKTSGFTATAEKNGKNETIITVSCADVKALGASDSSVVSVTYSATLNENAALGAAGNPNEVYLEYSNNPNRDSSGQPSEDMGKTPVDRVIVFTYKAIVDKVRQNGTDGAGQPVYEALSGAEFTLQKKQQDNSWKTIQTVKNDTGDSFSFIGLDDGEYCLTETVTPAGYNSIDPIFFTVTAEHDILSDAPALTSLSGNAASGELTFTADVTGGTLTTAVVNQSGTTLPETGGMGTTLFYVLGGLLAAGAAIVLVARKRMSMEA